MAHDFNKSLVYLQSQLSFLIQVIGIFSGKICQRCLLTIEGGFRYEGSIKRDVTSVTRHMKSCNISGYKISKLKIL